MAQKILGKKLAKVYRSYTEMLAQEKPEMALVSMEAKLAPPMISDALNAGCHVFAEKPASVEVNHFAALVDQADRQHRNLMLALANRTNPEILAARKLISSGKLGKIYGLDMHLIADQTRLTHKSYHQKWYAQKKRAGGGHLIWLGIHWLDMAMYLTGSDITQVAGFIANVGGQPLDVEDSATATYRFENGTLGTITSGFYLDKGYHSHLKIWGSKGWLHIDHVDPHPLHWYINDGDKSGEVQVWKGKREPRGYTPFVREAIISCAENTPPPISNAESLRALKTVHAIYEAAESGRSVTIT